MEHNKKKYTLRDVASLANVSAGSVSRHINGDSTLKPKTVEKIKQAIEQLNYVPNNIAKKLGSGKSKNILLVLAFENPIATSTWLYGGGIVQGIFSSFQGSGYSLQLTLANAANEDELCEQIISNYISKSVDGAIILSAWILSENLVKTIESYGVPYVLVGSRNNLAGTNEVLVDNFKAVEGLIDHLVAQGHTKIAMITGELEHEHMTERLMGYRCGLKRHGLEYENVRIGEFTYEMGVKYANDILDDTAIHKPTAIICGNDYIALGVVKTLKERGICVPNDIAVAGFDDVPSAKAVEPALTTIRLPLVEMGIAASQKMLKMMGNPHKHMESEVLDCQLIVRDSTKIRKH